MKVGLLLLLFIASSPNLVFAQDNKIIAILEPLDKQNRFEYGMKLLFRSKLGEAFSSINNYKVSDRMDLGSIFKEQEFQRTGMVSDEDIKRIGEFTGAQYVVISELVALGEDKIMLSAQILDVETAKIVASDSFIASNANSLMERNCKELVKNLVAKYVDKDDEIDLNTDIFDDNDEILTAVEHPAHFPGGQEGLMKFLSNNIKYPQGAQDKGIRGRVVLHFVVEKDGSVSNIEIVKSVDEELDAEAVRVVKRMPNWIPGKNNNHPVRSYFTLPITFKLQNE